MRASLSLLGWTSTYSFTDTAKPAHRTIQLATKQRVYSGWGSTKWLYDEE
jgi:hypothetical protein